MTLVQGHGSGKFWMCFFKVKYSVGHISGMVGSIDLKRKGVGYWVNYVTLTFDLIRDLDLGFFKVKFQYSSGCTQTGKVLEF